MTRTAPYRALLAVVLLGLSIGVTSARVPCLPGTVVVRAGSVSQVVGVYPPLYRTDEVKPLGCWQLGSETP